MKATLDDYNQPHVHPLHDFRHIDIDVTELVITQRLGDYTIQVTRDHSEDWCTCPSGTHGGHREPIRFHPTADYSGQRGPCKHLRRLWGLAGILWAQAYQHRPTRDEDRICYSFEQALEIASQGHVKEAHIREGFELAIKRSIESHLGGIGTFSMDLIADHRIESRPNQRWKTAITRRLIRCSCGHSDRYHQDNHGPCKARGCLCQRYYGWWQRTGRPTNSRVEVHNSYAITEYKLGPRGLDEIKGREDTQGAMGGRDAAAQAPNT